MAAVLAYGEGATLSHRSAAELWACCPHRCGPVDVTVPGHGGRRKRRGIRLHRSPLLTPAVTTIRNGITVTTPARTLADLRRACATRDELGSGDPPGRGRWDCRSASGRRAPTCTRSELERRFLRLCRRHRLPTPEVNARIGPFIVDFLWRDRALIVETDGYRFHRGR